MDAQLTTFLDEKTEAGSMPADLFADCFLVRVGATRTHEQKTTVLEMMKARGLLSADRSRVFKQLKASALATDPVRGCPVITPL